MKRLMVSYTIFFFIACSVSASGPGTTNANFLKASQGVRPVAMGETYIALGQGLDTLYWNPAGLVQLSSPSVSFIHNFWFQDIGTEYLAYGTPLGPLGAIGAGVTVLHTGAIDKTLEDQYGNYAGTAGQASAMSIAFVGAYSHKLSGLMPVPDGFLKNLLVGASLRLVNETIADTSIFGGAIDVGAIWRETEEISARDAGLLGAKDESKMLQRDSGWRAGFVAQNLGMTTDNLMPINFRLGTGYVINELFSAGGRGTLAADILAPIDNVVRVSLGAEYAHLSENTEFAARVGYKIGSEIKDLDSTAGLTAGVGFALSAGLIKYQVDYAFVPYGELGAIHRASLTLGFLPSENVVRSIPAAVSAAPLPVAPKTAPAAEKPAATGKAVAAEKPVAPTAAPAAAAPAAAAPAAEAPSPRPSQLAQALNRLQGRVKAGMLPGILFKHGETKPGPEAHATMDELGKIMEADSEATVTVLGYDSDQAAAVEKAKSVVKYVTMNFRISPDRMHVKAGDPAKQPKNSMIGFEAGAAK